MAILWIISGVLMICILVLFLLIGHLFSEINNLKKRLEHWDRANDSKTEMYRLQKRMKDIEDSINYIQNDLRRKIPIITPPLKGYPERYFYENEESQYKTGNNNLEEPIRQGASYCNHPIRNDGTKQRTSQEPRTEFFPEPLDKGNKIYYFRNFVNKEEGRFKVTVLGNIAKFSPIICGLTDMLDIESLRRAIKFEGVTRNKANQFEIKSNGRAELNEENQWIIIEKAIVELKK